MVVLKTLCGLVILLPLGVSRFVLHAIFRTNVRITNHPNVPSQSIALPFSINIIISQFSLLFPKLRCRSACTEECTLQAAVSGETDTRVSSETAT